jgi:hypothetical protein
MSAAFELVQRRRFEDAHVYSRSAEAGRKRAIDMRIMGGRFTYDLVNYNSHFYMEQLIAAAGGAIGTGGPTRLLQFFIIRGGAEGFLSDYYRDKDAGRVLIPGEDTERRPATFIFDCRDLLAVFDGGGGLVGSAPLERPLVVPGKITEPTAQRVYNAWDGQPVRLYRNAGFEVKYYGLVVYDKLGAYQNGSVRIDIHKTEATNGCILIVDSDTPPLSDVARLNQFEPKLIKDIQAAIGAREKYHIGTMRMLKI